MKLKTLMALSVASVVLAGCATNQNGRVVPDTSVFNKNSTISLGAGALGGLVCNQLFEGHGSRDTWTAICGAGGYFLGQTFTRNSNDVLENNTLGQSSSWNDPDGGKVAMRPTRTYYDNSQRPCRDYRTTVELDGHTEILTGTACRRPDGTWEHINS